MPQVRIQVLYGPSRRGEWYAWRLIGANNHELGRSALTFPSYQAALDGFATLRDGLDRLVQRSVHDVPARRWGWRVELDGAVVATSGRWYQRDRDSLVRAARFVALSAKAALAEGVVALR